ncbi:hypothetical protein KIW84_034415 [Lathyrus oleraceus]|uniref:Uncharacterized protein n=1 Tax=Pisum sativum TaxID=3888 RepID=A0A9D5B4I3_PEA|nr:hypothetical protein KIW84_034415 [Pisum sativum]
MEETRSIDRADLVLGLFLDSMTSGFLNQVVIDEHIEDSLKKDNKPKVAASVLPLLPQEQRVLLHQRPAQNNQKLKQKQISQKKNDQEGRSPHYDIILMSYAHVLLVLVNVKAIMSKKIEPSRFPYGRKHDPRAICGYHTGYVGNSIENCYPFKVRVQEPINHKWLSFTPFTTEAPVEKR